MWKTLRVYYFVLDVNWDSFRLILDIFWDLSNLVAFVSYIYYSISKSKPNLNTLIPGHIFIELPIWLDGS